MQNQHLIQLIVIAVIAGLSGLSWLYRKVREQQALKRIEDERRRREEEILRTGRDPLARPQPAEAAEEHRRVQEIVTRREAELQELRRRQATRAMRPGGSGETPGGILIQIPGTRAPIVVKPIPRGARMFPPAAPIPAPTGRPPGTPARPARPARTRGTPGGKRPAPQRKPEPAGTSPQEHGAHSAGFEERPPASSPAITPGSVRPAAVVQNMTPDDWRRAFVMRELLAPPLAARDPSAGDREPF